MKKILFSALTLVCVSGAMAQQKEGKVTYKRDAHMQMMINNGNGDQNISRTRTDKFELNFANNKMHWKQLEDEIQDDGGPEGGGGPVIRTFGGGADDVIYCDLDLAKKVEQRELFDKKFLVTDSIRRGNWKLTDETKTILNHLCRKATSQRIAKRMTMSMNNGNMERKEVDDTSTIVAWFTTDIPVAVGPEVQGQLPGLILELETNGGRTVYTALEISPKANISAIKEPTKGKKMNQAQFNDERKKMLDEMQKNGGGSFQIRRN